MYINLTRQELYAANVEKRDIVIAMLFLLEKKHCTSSNINGVNVVSDRSKRLFQIETEFVEHMAKLKEEINKFSVGSKFSAEIKKLQKIKNDKFKPMLNSLSLHMNIELYQLYTKHIKKVITIYDKLEKYIEYILFDKKFKSISGFSEIQKNLEVLLKSVSVLKKAYEKFEQTYSLDELAFNIDIPKQLKDKELYLSIINSNSLLAKKSYKELVLNYKNLATLYNLLNNIQKTIPNLGSIRILICYYFQKVSTRYRNKGKSEYRLCAIEEWNGDKKRRKEVLVEDCENLGMRCVYPLLSQNLENLNYIISENDFFIISYEIAIKNFQFLKEVLEHNKKIYICESANTERLEGMNKYLKEKINTKEIILTKKSLFEMILKIASVNLLKKDL
ncbi:MAG: hypothetical protein RSE00_01465 [Clostridia bacterium]